MQFEIGISIRRYMPPSGTAGFERMLVNGYSRDPRPPPKTSAMVLRIMAGSLNVTVGCAEDMIVNMQAGIIEDSRRQGNNLAETLGIARR